jgi:hypothetical protein
LATELLALHQGSLELEALGGQLTLNQTSTSGKVKHVGEGVFVEQNTIAIDPDSAKSSPYCCRTITRRDQREVARLAIETVDNPVNFPKVTCVGQAGTGKTRGALAYTLQELLWRGEAVMRVGYKDTMVYLFLPDETGKYKVWSTTTTHWPDSQLARDKRTYALIDPPEKAGGSYLDTALCKLIKYASNNAEKHYRNWAKDGMLLLTAMPTLAEMLVMVPYLWDEELTPLPEQLRNSDLPFGTDAAKAAEITRRCKLVGCVIRVVFSHSQFRAQLEGIVQASESLGSTMNPARLVKFYYGMTTNPEGEPSSLSSKMFIMGAMPGDASHKAMLAYLNPLAVVVLKEQLAENITGFNGTRWSTFEQYCLSVFKEKGKSLVSGSKDTAAATSESILNMKDGQFVKTSTNYPVFDYATSPYDWYNAKVRGPEVQSGEVKISSSAFVTVLENLKLAAIDAAGTGLVWKGEEKTITLTMMCNNGSTSWKFEDTFKSLKEENKKFGLKFAKVTAFFKKHVTVKTLDVSKIADAQDDMAETIEIADQYKKLIGEFLNVKSNESKVDVFTQYSDAIKMEEVVRAIAEKEGFFENTERWQKHLSKLTENEIDTVGNLRALSVEQIKELGLPPVVTAYMLRVKKGGK